MVTVLDLYNKLLGLFPDSLSCSWDNDGLMCHPRQREVRRVLVALDASERVIDHAAENGYDLILTHHPLIFKPIKYMDFSLPSPRKLIKLINAGICVISLHSRLDAAAGGVNDILAGKLGLSDIRPFGQQDDRVGRIGILPGMMTLAEFCGKIKSALGCPFVLAANGGIEPKRIAVVGGDGKDYIGAAAAAGADTFVSGRIGYNNMNEAPEIALNLIEAGHFYTENPVCEYLAKLVGDFAPGSESDILNSLEIRIY